MKEKFALANGYWPILINENGRFVFGYGDKRERVSPFDVKAQYKILSVDEALEYVRIESRYDKYVQDKNFILTRLLYAKLLEDDV